MKATLFNCYLNPLLKREVCGGDFETTIQRSLWGINWGLDLGIPDRVRLVVQVEAVGSRRGAATHGAPPRAALGQSPAAPSDACSLDPPPAHAEPVVYRLDPTHSFVHFEVRHFGTSTTRGRVGPIAGRGARSTARPAGAR